MKVGDASYTVSGDVPYVLHKMYIFFLLEAKDTDIAKTGFTHSR